jgi:hypothetical protein
LGLSDPSDTALNIILSTVVENIFCRGIANRKKFDNLRKPITNGKTNMTKENKFTTALKLADQYKPYSGMPEFWRGYREYMKGEYTELNGVEAQAYDRGHELAMRIGRD